MKPRASSLSEYIKGEIKTIYESEKCPTIIKRYIVPAPFDRQYAIIQIRTNVPHNDINANGSIPIGKYIDNALKYLGFVQEASNVVKARNAFEWKIGQVRGNGSRFRAVLFVGIVGRSHGNVRRALVFFYTSAILGIVVATDGECRSSFVVEFTGTRRRRSHSGRNNRTYAANADDDDNEQEEKSPADLLLLSLVNATGAEVHEQKRNPIQSTQQHAVSHPWVVVE